MIKKVFSHPKYKFLPATGWFFVVLWLICLPADDMPKIKNAFTLFLEQIHFDKIVHFFMFGIMMALFGLPFILKNGANSLKTLAIITFLVILWGLGTEFIQHYFTRGRSYDLYDWAADSVGALAALCFSYFAFIKGQWLLR